ncbi:arginase [Anaerocolumna cellulosilytica]|uniref:Arginase n=1 Tax=Anaerocolumna cellulosilytica TaxID=433286 RepID=A0A6S6R5A5_9FIRM|nr:arginase family protein [Anaerocolumna cellulosilytica]MBB5194798.1 arginase family enzyme [Anaerocolumna cellulosilytica]BCJ94238.1 arginase [Anaerocolumna cellulosilytica]
MQVYTIDFEGIYTEQSWYLTRKDKIKNMDIIPYEGTNGYCSQKSCEVLQAYCSNLDFPAVTYLGSGNYHYLTYFLLQQIKKPFSMVMFDFHSDIQMGMCKELLSCGNWVRFALENCSQLKQVYIVGVAEQYIPKDYDCCGKEVHFITEKQVRSIDWIEEVKRGIQYPIYITIDKDVFREGTVYTNWDQGTMEINDVSAFFEGVRARHKILGGDICGECSKNYADGQYNRYQEVNGIINQQILTYFHMANR